ncbi:FkbM family methyltransferase [Geitlerinema sp. PCC 9228]|uniref:FkbM family methyltransferase n=1 Tax=Geitlerinema sp. PCC 9228 TaxID=111611 RepID=UPI0008F9CCEE|nr:FkbM family methyltransferase [Geitlerinema sp. PCC 9228]
MHVEPCCQALLNHFLPKLDPKRSGICIDVGVGTFAFYCEKFARLGFQTWVVEPLPVRQLRSRCQQHQISLIEACLSDRDGRQPLYMGKFAGQANSNFSSLSADWFGSSSTTKIVETLSLPSLFARIQSKELTCLKMDVEGWESTIIAQLSDLPRSLLPKVIMFEYGGGSNRQTGNRGWSSKYIQGTMQCLDVLKSCGYGTSILVDMVSRSQERVFHLQKDRLTPDSIFYENAVYGNIISFLDFEESLDEISEICRPYYNNTFIFWIETKVQAIFQL